MEPRDEDEVEVQIEQLFTRFVDMIENREWDLLSDK
jgi:hypothetical protein